MPQRDLIPIDPWTIARVVNVDPLIGLGMLLAKHLEATVYAQPPRGTFMDGAVIWVPEPEVKRLQQSVPFPGNEQDPPRIYSVLIRSFAVGDEWRLDLGHVAQARAHAELRALFLFPLRRLVRRLTRLLERS